jgi:dihydroorotate dehydrogenase
MPDWSYVPLFRPLLARLGMRRARATALGAMRALAALPFGDRFIEAFGDLAPPPELARTIAGIVFASPVGVGAGLDVAVVATSALARLGAGFVEIGPVTRLPIAGGAIERDGAGAIVYASPFENAGLERTVRRLRTAKRTPAQIAVRLSHAPNVGIAEAAGEIDEAMTALAPLAAFFVLDLRVALDERWDAARIDDLIRRACASATNTEPRRPALVAIPPDAGVELARRLASHAVASGAAGVSVCGGERVVTADGRSARRTGPPTRRASIVLVRTLRDVLGPSAVIIGSGGIVSPDDAHAFFDAGATLVQVHTGLADGGPGALKRANDALVMRSARDPAGPAPVSLRYRWTWLVLLGVGLGVVSSLAGAVALTSVVLPYDERYLGISRASIAAFDDRLLPFMVHDRVTLAGTLLALGILYAALAAFPVRYGERWAWRAITLSAAVGFASYWLWLRLGFADPLHAIATAISIAFYGAACCSIARLRTRGSLDRNDRAWRRSLAAQLLFVTCGVGFMIGGATIAVVGISSIFVQTDLTFLHTTPAVLSCANPRLAPLIAHDRAGFGGVLFADGVAVALTVMWGFRRGARWLWWTLLASAIPGFGATLAVHIAIGYVDFWHLAPVYFALVLYVAGLALAREYLVANA